MMCPWQKRRPIYDIPAVLTIEFWALNVLIPSHNVPLFTWNTTAQCGTEENTKFVV